jgi:hypothetical protein
VTRVRSQSAMGFAAVNRANRLNASDMVLRDNPNATGVAKRSGGVVRDEEVGCPTPSVAGSRTGFKRIRLETLPVDTGFHPVVLHLLVAKDYGDSWTR